MRIPAGVADGQRIRLKGRGGPGQNGGPPGDLYVVVRVSPHPIFARKGNDLTLTVPDHVPGGGPRRRHRRAHPRRRARSRVRIPAGTRSGRTFRVKGKGVATAKATGDLLATVEVAVPAKLARAERKALEAYQAASNGASPREHLGVLMMAEPANPPAPST